MNVYTSQRCILQVNKFPCMYSGYDVRDRHILWGLGFVSRAVIFSATATNVDNTFFDKFPGKISSQWFGFAISGGVCFVHLLHTVVGTPSVTVSPSGRCGYVEKRKGHNGDYQSFYLDGNCETKRFSACQKPTGIMLCFT